MKDTNNISCWIFLCTMDAPKILMSSKILIKKWRDSFLCISAHACWYRNTLCVFLLPSLLPAFLPLFLYTLLLVDFYCLLPSRRDINHFEAEVIFRKMLILSGKCFSYWKIIDLIRNMKASFTCPWSLRIWLPLCCHCKIEAEMRMLLQKTFLQFCFFIAEAAWMAQHRFRYWGYTAVRSLLLILSSQREPGLK